MYIITDTDTDTTSEGEDNVLPPIHELPTCELSPQPPSREIILEKRVSELEK